MSIKTFFRNIVENQLDANGDVYSFKHGSKGWLNLIADEQQLPAVYLYEPIENDDLLLAGGLIQEKFNVMLLILYKEDATEEIIHDLDSTPEQTDVLIQKARNTKNQLLTILRKSEDVKEVVNSKTMEFEHEFDIEASGISLGLQVTMNQKQNVCL